jgi:hypothetical protein
MNKPARFELSFVLDASSVRYSHVDGEQTLTLGDKTYSGDALVVHELDIGTLLTVTTLPSDRAGRARRFALLLPDVRGEGTHDVRALGINVVDSVGAVGAPAGSLITYDVSDLIGTSTIGP